MSLEDVVKKLTRNFADLQVELNNIITQEAIEQMTTEQQAEIHNALNINLDEL